jgi:PhnB protein
MPQNPPEGYGRIMPYLYYEDPAAAIDWIVNAFGFTERLRMPGPEGGVMHAELERDGAVVMLGRPGEDYRNPKNTGASTFSLYVYVDDVDKHADQARSGGAQIKRDLEDTFYGDRIYQAADPEGHVWVFATHTRDVSPEEMEAAMAGAGTGTES